MGRCCHSARSQYPLENIPRHIWCQLFGCYRRVCTRRKEFEGVLAHYREPQNHSIHGYQRWDVFTLGCELLCYVSMVLSLTRVLRLTLCRWGYPFLYESYFYHLHRLDHRHNFSPYFYLTYLTYPSLSGAPEPLPLWNQILRSPLTSFVPQMGLALGLGLLFGRRKEDLVFTWFVQTVVFVVFNKVCTSQVSIFHTFKRVLLIGICFGSTSFGIFYCYRCSFHGYR